MNDVAIRVENLSKRYRIGEKVPYKALRDEITRLFTAPFRKLKNPSAPKGENGHIWALKDVSFEVKRGEVVGIIGRNGVGKTTLLKLLSRITEPTEGYAEIHGRVGSLLEVGTGFHPELTGRENIYLNGAILGMRKQEIAEKFDEIVSFAEIGKFIDTPVKRYSSGMYVRLAFAVAAHLEPEILLVDEVLAVGDIGFQKKCLGKMGDVAKEGRTVLFVSHNMGSIQDLCDRALLLNEGIVVLDGPARATVRKYLTMGLKQSGERVWPDINQAPGDEVARMRAVRVIDRHGQVCTHFDVRDPISLEMEYWVLRNVKWLDASFYFYNERGWLIIVSVDDSTDSSLGNRQRSPGFYRSTCHIPADLLNNGQFSVQVALTDEMVIHTIQRDVVMFHVGDAMDSGGVRGNYRSEWAPAAVRPRLQWSMERFPLSHTDEHVK